MHAQELQVGSVVERRLLLVELWGRPPVETWKPCGVVRIEGDAVTVRYGLDGTFEVVERSQLRLARLHAPT
jgi:hypothetical protein